MDLGTVNRENIFRINFHIKSSYNFMTISLGMLINNCRSFLISGSFIFSNYFSKAIFVII